MLKVCLLMLIEIIL